MIEAATDRDAHTALQALGAFRVLCAHRRGPHGVDTWTAQIEGWLADELDDFTLGPRWYVGRPLLVTENDYELGLFNGDTGVVVTTGPNRIAAAFERRGAIIEFSPTRLAAVETVYAMTIHKAQGSQFDTAAVLLPRQPPRSSPESSSTPRSPAPNPADPRRERGDRPSSDPPPCRASLRPPRPPLWQS